MRVRQVACLAGAWLIGGLTAPGRGAENQPPRVTIETPEHGDVFEWDRLVRYAVRVSDPEDGESGYDEIDRNEVFLEVIWVADATPESALAAATRLDPPDLALMKSSNCFNCHAANSWLLGPPFAEIAARYRGEPATLERLAERVRVGSSGVWGDMPMLPHPDLTSGELRRMVRWVLEHGADPGRRLYAGTEGAFRARPDPGGGARGVYVLAASYTDHGSRDSGQQRRRGQHAIALRCPEPGQEVSDDE